MGGKNSYESIKRYQDKVYDKILVRLPKGQKDTLQAHAQAQGESVNGFIGRAISETMERDLASSIANTSRENQEDETFYQKMVQDYEEDPDKGDPISVEDFVQQLDIIIEEQKEV